MNLRESLLDNFGDIFHHQNLFEVCNLAEVCPHYGQEGGDEALVSLRGLGMLQTDPVSPGVKKGLKVGG